MATEPVAPEDIVMLAAKAVEIDIDCGWSLEECRSTGIAVLDAIPDGWAKVGGKWVRRPLTEAEQLEKYGRLLD